MAGSWPTRPPASTDDLISALRPMRARRPQARFAMLSTAWSRTDPFWTAWASDDPSWMRLKATAESTGAVGMHNFSRQERLNLGEHNTSANISASRGVERPVHSAGTSMSAPPEFARRWCRQERPLRRPLNNPCLVSTRSAIFKSMEHFDDLRSR